MAMLVRAAAGPANAGAPEMPRVSSPSSAASAAARAMANAAALAAARGCQPASSVADFSSSARSLMPRTMTRQGVVQVPGLRDASCLHLDRDCVVVVLAQPLASADTAEY